MIPLWVIFGLHCTSVKHEKNLRLNSRRSKRAFPPPQPLPRQIRNRNQKFDKNITKRGNVPIGKAAEREDDYPVSKGLIAFFLFLIVGSSVVQVLNLFRKGPALEE